MDTETILCEQCKMPVLPHEALVVELEDDKERMRTAVFHKPPAECASIYSIERLKLIGFKLQELLRTLADAQQELREQNKDKGEEEDDDAEF